MPARRIVLSADQWRALRGLAREALDENRDAMGQRYWWEHVVWCREKMGPKLVGGMAGEELAHAFAMAIYDTVVIGGVEREAIRNLLFSPDAVLRNRGVIVAPGLDECENGRYPKPGWSCAATLLMATELEFEDPFNGSEHLAMMRAKSVLNANRDWPKAAAVMCREGRRMPIWRKGNSDDLILLSALVEQGVRLSPEYGRWLVEALERSYPLAGYKLSGERMTEAIAASGVTITDSVGTDHFRRPISRILTNMSLPNNHDARRLLAGNLYKSLMANYQKALVEKNLKVLRRAPMKTPIMPGL